MNTLNDYADLSGKICLVTGSTSGIGRAAAEKLASQDATVVLVARNEQKAFTALNEIKEKTGNQRITFLIADLSIQKQVRNLAENFLRQYERLDILINNAGAFFLFRRVSRDGIEMNFALNHLAYFLLTHLLLDTIIQTSRHAGEARIINVASSAHLNKKLDFNDLEMKRNYHPMQAYGRSKLANLYFTFELARRLADTGVTAQALHPGWVRTGIGANNGWLVRALLPLIMQNAIPPEDGAKTLVYLAGSSELKESSGEYFVKCRSVAADPIAYDRDASTRLWSISEQMVGIQSFL